MRTNPTNYRPFERDSWTLNLRHDKWSAVGVGWGCVHSARWVTIERLANSEMRVLGVHPVEDVEGCVLIESMILNASGQPDFGQVTQPHEALIAQTGGMRDAGSVQCNHRIGQKSPVVDQLR